MTQSVSLFGQTIQLKADNIDQVVEAGQYTILIGASSTDIRHRQEVRIKGYTEPVSNVLNLNTKLNILKKVQ